MIKDLRLALDSKQISAKELLDSFFEKAEKQSELNCFINTDYEFSKQQAERAQKMIDEKKSTILTGIPIAVKDNILTRGVKTTCASKMLKDYIPDFNATVIDKLENAGYILSGKTNMDEFAMGNTSENSYFNPVKNPICKELIAGGSSGGSAVSVASSLCPVSLGSDTGGSVRQPASFCGCIGLKPTYGKISRYGLIAFASSLDQIGIFSKTAEDALFVLNTIAGKDEKDSTSLSSKLCEFKPVKGKIGLPKEFFESADKEIADCVEKAALNFEKSGFSVEYCSLKHLKYAASAYYILSSAEAASNLSRFDGVKYGFSHPGTSFYDILRYSRGEGFGKEVKRRILLGNYCLSEGFYDKYYIKAQGVQKQLKTEFSELFETFDFLITPTAPTLPHSSGKVLSPSEIYNADILTVPANLTGLPSLNIPCGKINGLYVGMSITGNHFCESEILSLADIFEKEYRI